MNTKSVLMVCMGNICRSPTAEAVLRHYAKAAGVRVNIDSAGTISYHTGKRPDPRAIKAGQKRGYDFEEINSRKVVVKDFYDFDLLLAMDQSNYDDLRKLCPEPHLEDKIRLFLEFSKQEKFIEVPDPYYGGHRGFELVLDLVEDASQGLIEIVAIQDEF